MTLVLATMTLAVVSCGPKKETPKTLVVFYSQTSNTKVVAEKLASQVGADLAEIVPVQPYDGDFHATIERGKKELDEGAFPEIQPLKVDVADYDVIFIGYPIWFGTYAPPVFTFLSFNTLFVEEKPFGPLHRHVPSVGATGVSSTDEPGSTTTIVGLNTVPCLTLMWETSRC